MMLGLIVLLLLAILGAILGGFWGAVIAVALPFAPYAIFAPFAAWGLVLRGWDALWAKPEPKAPANRR